MDIPTRNRAIKRTLSAAFAPHKVTVRGSRGTSYGWATVHIAYSPLDIDEAGKLRALAYKLLRLANIDLGSRYTDDTCEHTAPEVRVEFNRPRYWRTHRSADGKLLAYIPCGGGHGDKWIFTADGCP